MIDDEVHHRSLIAAVSIMHTFAEGSAGTMEERAVQMRAANAILREVEGETDLRTITLILGAIGTWGIVGLIPRALPGEDPKDWILQYVQEAFSLVERGG
jgi:hypothetical protein